VDGAELGRWAAFGAPANVDWCEPNFVYSPWVAEAWNTLSSVPIAALGLVALLAARRGAWRAEPRFAVGALAVTVVGLGSVAFHGTLLRLAQAADELPMIYTGLAFLHVLRWRAAGRPPDPDERRRMRRWALGLVGYAVAFTVAYLFLAAWFLPFILTYAGIVAWIVLRSGQLSLIGAPEPGRRRWLLLSAGSYVGGVLLLWIPEHVLLPCDHPLQAAQLHAWFHLTSAVGSAAWLGWALHDRRLALAALSAASRG
jgi:dihydroceramidase